MRQAGRHRATVKILVLYCGHAAARVRPSYQPGMAWPEGVPCPHGCGGGAVQHVRGWVDTSELAPARKGS